MDENGRGINLSSDHEVQTDGESWPCKGDKLERHKEIENLSTILLNARAPLVMAIDSPWGGGKTTFIKLWQHYLGGERGQESLYLNAWENDYVSDPLLPLLAQLNRWLSKKSIGKKVLRNLEKTAMKILKAGLVEQAGHIRFVGWFAKIVLKTLIDQYMKNPDSMSDFRQSLTDCLACVPGDQNLIVFVDELDRCNPLYAIAMLERIKHLFSVDRLIFVLAINSDQLAKSFMGVYGPDFDGKGYLRRFIHLSYSLKRPNTVEYIKDQFERFALSTSLEGRTVGGSYLKDLESAIALMTRRCGLQLRDVNQVIARIGLVLPAVDKKENVIDIFLMIMMLVLRDVDHGLYHKYIEDQAHAEEVLEKLTGLTLSSHSLPDEFVPLAGALFQFDPSDNYSKSKMTPILQRWQAQAANAQTGHTIAQQIKQMVGCVSNQWTTSDARDSTYERIELLSEIKISTD